MYVCAPCVFLMLLRARKGLGFPGTRVTADWELGIKPGVPKEKSVLLTTKSPPWCLFVCLFRRGLSGTYNSPAPLNPNHQGPPVFTSSLCELQTHATTSRIFISVLGIRLRLNSHDKPFADWAISSYSVILWILKVGGCWKRSGKKGLLCSTSLGYWRKPTAK